MADEYTPALLHSLDEAIRDARNCGHRAIQMRVSRAALAALQGLIGNEQFAFIGNGVRSPLIYRGVGVKPALGKWPDSYVAVTRFG